ncbi:TolC family protein, partial [Desulfobacca acetoxidans]
MIRKILALLVIIAVPLTGCTLIPEYTRPEAPIPQDWPSGPAYKNASPVPDAPLAAEVQWRTFFADQRLQTIIAMALKNNRDLQVAALSVEKARAMYRVQRAELFPTVETGISARKERVKISGTQGMVNL